jgi:LacI family transcriptional regulator
VPVPSISGARGRPTIADVARVAQVSKSTVSRVLNNRPDVDAATVATVVEAMSRLGYVPSSHAVGLAKGSTLSLGLLAPSMSAPWMLEVLRGVTEAIEVSDYSLTLYTMTQGHSSLEALHSRMRSQAIDGLAIMQPPYDGDNLRRLLGLGAPIVAIDARGAHPSLASVASNDEQGITSVVTHLLEMGRRRIAMICGPTRIACHRDRLRAFRDAMRAAGMDDTSPGHLVATDDTFAAGATAAALLLHGHPDVDAVVVGNDAMALGTLRTLTQAGRQVGHDVALAGFDDITASRYSDPPLTTVYNPLYEMGAAAARLLLDATKGNELPDEPVLLPTRLVVRRSTDPTAADPEHDLAHWRTTSPA